MTWLAALERCRARGDACVLVGVTELDGSAPRGVGARMLVTRAGAADTIGGGALEHAAIEHARELLSRDAGEPLVERRTWTLGRALSQCCGGRATLDFELVPACDFRVEVFGAGHVARELARVLRRLPCIATFHDPRPGWLAGLGADAWTNASAGASAGASARGPAAAVPDLDLGEAPGAGEGPGVLRASRLGENVHGALERCRPGALYLVMTHSHELDLEVCEAVLSRGDATYLGLIASKSKARAFRSRLAKKGFTDAELAGLTAPLGGAVRTGNTPMEVAVAALADVLTARERAREAVRGKAQAKARASALDSPTLRAVGGPDAGHD